jgi:hypothetical protein
MRNFESSPGSLVAGATVLGAAIILLAVSACTESKSEKSASQYADSLCASISGWETHVRGIASRLDTGSPASVTRAKLNEAAASTSGLVNQIHALDVPSVDGAAEAKQNVDRFVGDSQTTVTAVKAGVRQIQSYGTGAQNVAAVVVPLGLQLNNLVTEGRTTVGDLQAIKGPFEKAVKKSKTCQALKSSDDGQ